MPPIAPTVDTPLVDLHPQKSGWHLLQFADGSTAIVRYDNGQWMFGSQTVPTSPTVAMDYLGADVTGMSLNLGKYASELGNSTWMTIISQIDTGALSRGQPVVIGPSGDLQPGTLTNQGDATPINQIPSPIPPTAGNSNLGISFPSIFSTIGNLGFWKGIGLVLAGVGILVFAALELRKL